MEEELGYFGIEEFRTVQVALSDFSFFCFQHGSYDFSISGIYFYAENPGNPAGRNGIYVAKDSNEAVRRGICMEYPGVQRSSGWGGKCNDRRRPWLFYQSHGNPVYQAGWYLAAWVVISLICNGFNNLWMPVTSIYIPPAAYNLLVTFVTGGVSMIIFFFVFKMIFPEDSTLSEVC